MPILDKHEFEVTEQAIEFLHGYASFHRDIMQEITCAKNPLVFICRSINGDWDRAHKSSLGALQKSWDLLMRFL